MAERDRPPTTTAHLPVAGGCTGSANHAGAASAVPDEILPSEITPSASPPVEFEITDVLDLHSFPPREVVALVRDWLDLAHARGWRTLRIIHGRGIGVQRRTVRTLLARDQRVASFEDAPAGAGGWGATIIEMR